MVFNNAVMNQADFKALATGVMRVGIVLGDGTMSGPAGVGNASVCNKALACSVELGDTAHGANPLNGLCIRSLIWPAKHRKACGVVATVFQMPKPLDKKRNNIGIA